jgi:hypothetical protein
VVTGAAVPARFGAGARCAAPAAAAAFRFAGTPATRGPPVSSTLPRPAPARVAFVDRRYLQTAFVAAVLVVGEQAVSEFLVAR